MNEPTIETLAEELGRLQLADPMPNPDPAALAARGRRGLRRRRASGITAAAALVAGSVVAVNLATNLTSDGTAPPLTSPTTTQATSAPPSTATSPTTAASPSKAATIRTPVTVSGPVLTPMPGVPAGDAALQRLSQSEAERRCHLRHNDNRKINTVPEAIRGGNELSYAGDDPTGISNKDPNFCLIPGDSRPTAAALAAVDADPVPRDSAGQLRNCSVLLWHDVRDWRVVASDQVPGRAISLLARSPSGQFIADCKLRTNTPDHSPWMGIWPTAVRGVDGLKFVLGAGGCWDWSNADMRCLETLYQENGRVRADTARIEFTGQNGDLHVVRPWQGWYSVAWAPAGNGRLASIKAYDAAGKVLYQREGELSPTDPSLVER